MCPDQVNIILCNLYQTIERHIRPEYSHQSVGQRPEQHFKCTLKVEGYEKEAFGQASSKV